MAYLFDKNDYQLLDAAGFFLMDTEELVLITDRTAADVEQVRRLAQKGLANMTEIEKEEWLAGLKGAYNATDLNRVEAAVDYVARRLIPTGYIMDYTAKTNWQKTEYMSPTEAERFLGNIQKIRDGLVTGYEFPQVPTDLNKMTYQEANDIERILVLVNAIIDNVLSGYYYSNDLYAGEV